MIKILYVLNEFMYGSKVRQLCDLVEGLDRSEFQPEICSFDMGDEASADVENLGVPLFQLRLVPERSIKPSFAWQFLSSPFKLLRKKYDIIHSLCYQSVVTEPLIAKLCSNAKFVYTKTNLEWDNHEFNWNLKSRLADRIISISRATDDLLSEKGFFDKSHKISLGMNTEQFSIQPSKRERLRKDWQIEPEAMVFGCAAQFVEWKEQLTLIEAFERFAVTHREAHLVFCGGNHGDDYYRRVVEKIQSSKSKKRIHLMGTLQDMTAFYSMIDCFVLPSRYETFGYVYIEAMSCARPVIACRVGGPLDIIVDGETGLLTKVSDVEDLGKKLMFYIDNRTILTTHGRAGRERVKELFSKEAMVREHEKLYGSLVNQ